jgi:hypothetical protein
MLRVIRVKKEVRAENLIPRRYLRHLIDANNNL